MSSTVLRLVVLLVVASFGVKVFAHARIKTSGALVPRSTNPGLKTGPCGGIPRPASVPAFAPGSRLNVNWEETVDHPGRYEFYFSAAGEANFQLLASIPDTQNGA